MEPLNDKARDLAWLLKPLEVETFFGSYWEQRHLHLADRGSTYYLGLLDSTELETFLNTADLRYPALQLARDGRYVAPESYTHDLKHGSETFTGVPDLERVAAEYRNGATITLPALHRTWPPLQSLCGTLEGALDHAVHANAYLTPGNASGFTPHYDVHEVLVLQIAGHKHWSLYEPPLQLPHRSQPFNPHTYRPGPPMARLDLAPGDLLYLPRGYVHSTTTSMSHSVHITIGISVYTWADLLREQLPGAPARLELRQALPPGFAHRPELKNSLRAGLLAAVGDPETKAMPDSLLESFLARVRSGKNQRLEPLRIDIQVIGLHTWLRAPAPGSYRVLLDAGRATLEFQNKRYLLPPEVAPALQAITGSAGFKPAALPGQLSEAARLGLSRYLHEIGFLTTDL